MLRSFWAALVSRTARTSLTGPKHIPCLRNTNNNLEEKELEVVLIMTRMMYVFLYHFLALGIPRKTDYMLSGRSPRSKINYNLYTCI